MITEKKTFSDTTQTVRCDIQWTLTGREAIEQESMIGASTIIEKDGIVKYTGFFSYIKTPCLEYVLLDLGSNGHSKMSQVHLNGKHIGDIHGVFTNMHFCVSQKDLLEGENEIVISCFGNIERASVDGLCQEVYRTDYDLIPRNFMELKPFLPIGEVQKVSYNDQYALFECKRGQIRIAFPNNSLEIKGSSKSLKLRTAADELIFKDELKYEKFKFKDSEKCSNISCGNIIVSLNKASGAFSVSNNSSPIRDFMPLVAEDYFLLSWNLSNEEKIFGLGENAENGMQKRGTQEDIWLVHSFWKCDKPIPFLMSNNGYGIYLHSSFRSQIDIGYRENEKAFMFIDDAQIDLFFFINSKFLGMISAYTSITGRSPLPPKWAFGYWQSSTQYIAQKQLEENIDGFIKRDINIDVIAIDPVWQENAYQNLEWNKQHYPEPGKFLAKLKKENINLALWTAPFINPSSKHYNYAIDNGYVLTNSDGSPSKTNWWMGFDAVIVDFTNPKAVSWWQSLLEPLVKDGVRVIKIDGGDTNETPVTMNFASGSSMEELHNLFPLLFAKAVYSGMQNILKNERSITWIRTGCAGIQQYPCCWGGDQLANFAGGRVLIKAGQQAGLMGIPYWSHDLGGFSGTKPTEEYYIRSFQWGLLSPLSRAHGWEDAPWKKGERAEKIIKNFIGIRYALLPSIYSYAWKSHNSGQPMMYAMALRYQSDDAVYDKDYQYMFGPDLLVCPIYQQADQEDFSAQREIYLPDGIWYDYWTNKVFSGKQLVTVKAELSKIPLFVRGGGIFVKSKPVKKADASKLEIHCYCGGSGSIEYYEDDGISNDYMSKKYCTTCMNFSDTGQTAILNIGKTNGDFTGAVSQYNFAVYIYGVKTVKSVEVCGKKIENYNFNANEKILTFSVSKRKDEELNLNLGY